MSKKCCISDCCYTIFTDVKSCEYCIFHFQIKYNTPNGLYCKKSNCLNIKQRGGNGCCKKHVAVYSRCCTSRCSENEISGLGFCRLHSRTIQMCRIGYCKLPIDSIAGHCLKHRVDATYCCDSSCYNKCTNHIPFCLDHSKTKNICQSLWCFTRISKSNSEYCVKHLIDPTCCFKYGCQHPSFKNGLCIEHCKFAMVHEDYEEFVDVKPPMLKRKIHDITLDTDMEENISDFINLIDFDITTDYLEDLVYDWDLGNNTMDFTNVFL